MADQVRNVYLWSFVRRIGKQDRAFAVHASLLRYSEPVLGEVNLVGSVQNLSLHRGEDTVSSTVTAAEGRLITTSDGSQFQLVGDPSPGWAGYMDDRDHEWSKDDPFSWRKRGRWERFRRGASSWWQRVRSWRLW
jgi:hypothetical protein